MDESEDDAVARIFGALHPKVVVDGMVGLAAFRPEAEHRGNPGLLHGGMAATVLDHVCARTAAAALGHRVVTGTLNLRYPRPVPIVGGPYVVRAEAQRPRMRMVRVTAAIQGPDGEVLVEANGLFVSRPED